MTEESYTKFNNIILKAMAVTRFNATQFRLMHLIIRQTAGFHRPDHEFSLTYLQSNTGLSESSVRREINALLKNKVVIETKPPTKITSRKLAINHNVKDWTIPTDISFECSDLTSGECSDLTSGECSDLTSGECSDLTSGECSDLTSGSAQIRPVDKEKVLNKTSKESLNKQSDSEYTDDFNKFWDLYPRKIGKKESFKTYLKVLKQGGQAEEIITAANNYAFYCKQMKTEERYIKHAKTFLNDERYKDYLERVNNNAGNRRTGQFDFLNNDDRDRWGDEGSESDSIDLEGLI